MGAKKLLADLRPLSLKNHPDLSEGWLQNIIAEDPGILGLGDLELIQRERRQPQGGRLDLLLSDPDGATRFEVELQLGPTDETHIVRCVEYWDVERRRYPAYEHIAVLVAEDVTSRFLNVLSLFAGNIPIIVLQLNAFEVEGKTALTFTKILDQRALRDDESENDTEPKDRAYWLKRATKETVEIADNILGILNESSQKTCQLNYNKYYIGLVEGSKSNNFVYFRPKKKFTHVTAKISDGARWIEELDKADIQAKPGRQAGRIDATLTTSDLKENGKLISDFFKAVAEENS